jgi:acetyl esterase/lipase
MKVKTITNLFLLLILLCTYNANAASIIDNLVALKDNIISMVQDSNTKLNVSYEGSAFGKLDIYYDKNFDSDNLKPVVIFVHGGAWLFGDKYEYSKIGTYLREEGYVAVIPNYILFPKGKIDDMVNDVYQSIFWTYKNIHLYGGNENKIILSGHSAGAHLSVLTIIKSYLQLENLDKFLIPLPRLEKLVLFNGPYDFDDYDVVTNLITKENADHGVAERVVSKLLASDDIGPTDILKLYKDSSIPDFGVPKITFFYTDEDQLVPESSANNLIKQIRRVTTNTEINYIYNQGNGFDHSTLIYGARTDDEALKKMFLDIITL